MAQKRIYQIAKELNISHVEIVNFLKNKGVEVANHMAPVDNNIYDSILMEFSKEKASIDRLRKERARQAIIDNKEDLAEPADILKNSNLNIDKTEKAIEDEKEKPAVEKELLDEKIEKKETPEIKSNDI